MFPGGLAGGGGVRAVLEIPARLMGGFLEGGGLWWAFKEPLGAFRGHHAPSEERLGGLLGRLRGRLGCLWGHIRAFWAI